MLVCVDDLLITEDDVHRTASLKRDLHTTFTIKDLGWLVIFWKLNLLDHVLVSLLIRENIFSTFSLMLE